MEALHDMGDPTRQQRYLEHLRKGEDLSGPAGTLERLGDEHQKGFFSWLLKGGDL